MKSSSSAMRLKSAIRAFAAEEGIPPQVALQNFMFERFSREAFSRRVRATTMTCT